MNSKLNYTWSSEEEVCLVISGDYLTYNYEELKENLFKEIKNKPLKRLIINAENLGKWDSSLLAFIYEISKYLKEKSLEFDTSSLPEGVNKLLALAFSVDRTPNQSKSLKAPFLDAFGQKTINVYKSVLSGIGFLGETVKSIYRLFCGKAIMRPVDFMFALEDCSFKAFPIVSLISFMVGLIFGFVSSVQLRLFGAEIYVASLVAIAMVRVMGAVMAGIVMAGRTGSSYAATIGTMQVNEEIDALKTMGIPITDFLILPRIMSLMIMMPLLTMFSDILGMLGGAFVGIFMLDLSMSEYWSASIDAISLTHFFVGVFHGFVFGCVIAVCGCYYGIRSGKDADSVGKATTSAVVSSITWIIITTAIITVICESLNI